ncbi:MAG: hypothetical protein NVSMB43_11030 [Pseudarthrobacter sp.]
MIVGGFDPCGTGDENNRICSLLFWGLRFPEVPPQDIAVFTINRQSDGRHPNTSLSFARYPNFL